MGEAKRRREFNEWAHSRHPRGTREGGRFREKFSHTWAGAVAQLLAAAPAIAELELAERSEKALKAYEMGHLVAEGLLHVPGAHELKIRPGGDIPWDQRLSTRIDARVRAHVPTDVFGAQTRAERAADKRHYGHNLGERVETARGPGTIVRLSNNESGARVATIHFDDDVRLDYLIGPAHSPTQWRLDPRTSWATKLLAGLDQAAQYMEGQI